MSATPMPRPPSENTFQVAFKIPEAWVALADQIARDMGSFAGPGVTMTRTDALRAALWRGLESLSEQKWSPGEPPPPAPSRPRIKTDAKPKKR